MNEMMNQPTSEQPRKTHKVVYTIVERKGYKPFWLRVGVAFENRDKSLRVILDASPQNGQLHIRDPKPEDDRRGVGGSNGAFPGNGSGAFPGLEDLS